MKPWAIGLLIILLANATPTRADGLFIEAGWHGPNYGGNFATIQAGRNL